MWYETCLGGRIHDRHISVTTKCHCYFKCYLNFTFTFHFHALEKEMATHSSVLAWRIPGTAEPGGLLSMGSHRVGHDWNNLAADGKESVCNAGDLGSIPGSGRSPEEGQGNPLQYSCLENSMDRGAWWATIHGVTKSWTWLSTRNINDLIRKMCKKLKSNTSLDTWGSIFLWKFCGNVGY